MIHHINGKKKGKPYGHIKQHGKKNMTKFNIIHESNNSQETIKRSKLHQPDEGH